MLCNVRQDTEAENQTVPSGRCRWSCAPPVTRTRTSTVATSTAIEITCGSCGTVWARDLTPRCDTCGRTDLRDALQAILDKSRGTQLSIQGMKVVWLCPDCDAEKLRRWLDSNVPLPPDDLPVDPR